MNAGIINNNLYNNLLNINVNDISYKLVQKLITSHILRRLDDTQKAIVAALPQLTIIATDNYFVHYSMFPRLRDSNPDEILEIVRKELSNYVATPQFATVHAITMLNDVLSRLYATKLTEAIITQLEEKLNEKAKNDEELKNALDTAQKTIQLSRQNSTAVPCAECKAQEALQKIANAIRDVMVQEGEKLLRRARYKAKKATENAKEVLQLIHGKEAGKEEGTFELVANLVDELLNVRNAEKIIALANKIYAHMPKFTSVKKVIDKFGDEVAGYRHTHNPARALPRDLALPDELFYVKLVNGFTAHEKRRVVEGALYILVDKSGSMSAEKTIWARSTALALWKLARMKRRKYYLRFFDYAVHPYDEPISDPTAALNYIIKIPANGGTDIDRALNVALDDITQLRGATNTIVLITDGEDDVTISPEEFKKRNVRLVAVMIKGHNSKLRDLAQKTYGEYLRVEPDEKGALKIVGAI